MHVYEVFGAHAPCVGSFSTYAWHKTANDSVERLELSRGTGDPDRIVFPNYMYGEDYLTGITDSLFYGRWIESTSAGFQLSDEHGSAINFPPSIIEASAGNTPEEVAKDYRMKAEEREKARQDAEDRRIASETDRQAISQALDNAQKKKLYEEKKRQALEAKALKTLAQLLVAQFENSRYARDPDKILPNGQTVKGKTKCNFFVADFVKAFLGDGVELPELYKNGSPRLASDMLKQLRDATDTPPTGNQKPQWINAREFLGTTHNVPTGTDKDRRLDVYAELLKIGWEKSKEGKIVVVAMEGHVGVIMPYEKLVNGQNAWQNRLIPPIAQAGKKISAETTVALGFGSPDSIGVYSGPEPTDKQAPLGVFIYELWTPKFVIAQRPRPAWEVTFMDGWKNIFSNTKNDVNEAIQQVGKEIGKIFGL